MECCYQMWVVASNWYLDILDKLQKQVYGTVGFTFTTSLEGLAHRRNGAS